MIVKDNNTSYAILIELRAPLKSERSLYGKTLTEKNLAKVFLNNKQSNKELVDTFFHEMTHVFIEWQKKKMSPQKEELIARKIGGMFKKELI